MTLLIPVEIMSGPVYISTPEYWATSGQNFRPMMYKNYQKGNGLLYRKRAYMTPVKTDVTYVTPMAAETDRAVSELKEAVRNEEPHMPLKGTSKSKTSTHTLTSKAKRHELEKKEKQIENFSRNLKKVAKKTKRERKPKKLPLGKPLK